MGCLDRAKAAIAKAPGATLLQGFGPASRRRLRTADYILIDRSQVP